MRPVALIQRRLKEKGSPEVKAWWERYLKGAVPFRGVPMGTIRTVVHEQWRAAEVAALGVEDRKGLAFELLRQRFAEDKLAGIIALQECLLDALGAADLPVIAGLFRDGHVADWNTCDWLSVKVLGRLVAHASDPRDMAGRLTAWSDMPGLWQRRASVVSLVKLAKRGGTVFPDLPPLILGTCATLAASPERFCQTGIGWVLRELSLAERDAVAAFAHAHHTALSRKAMHYIVEKMPNDLAAELLALHGAQSKRAEVKAEVK